jgi:hypothetical protein
MKPISMDMVIPRKPPIFDESEAHEANDDALEYKRFTSNTTLTLNHNFAGSYWKFLYKFAILHPWKYPGRR